MRQEARFEVASNVAVNVGLRLRQPLSLDRASFERHYRQSLALPYPLVTNLNSSADLVARFEEQSTASNGVDLEIQSMRYYPFHTLAVHLLGHLQFDDRSVEGEESYFTYRLPDYSGAVGLEHTFDGSLRGHAGEKTVVVNSVGYRQTENVWNEAKAGDNVVLTIDLGIQQSRRTSARGCRRSLRNQCAAPPW